ncbi:MAG TPA: bifunctional phosphopantothenoylcysteine decarboxylase/phosphopantothenate--cysteine ligase CoaBC [Candidatus Marinimicrobia bacterium]|nr:bifunctional phosphopantothenoylcysteine decarboxylase/phosphopantothenate--cysteine ligase CoaBC [Candidatus Neomarinimicrobiota bacterium]HRS51871.1 bifunctional phosphopantothenoylcysteine decarboxylase/phosphopantothenate--cysteine ligase CoaBC [Candidatus Neomarinimicrobiota bacterium]HRU92668.1 bifunctional phosphopantothenoylcysteine decarboxylase/phosphopantothenate--cysteine ligase CoaBC [Candidatus Neomarinimicrobiota bacterium]
MNLTNRKIVLGLTGGISIYKSAGLLRRLVNDCNADVTVIMTDAAQQFMSPLIFETYSHKPVLIDMFAGQKIGTRHVDLATEADLILVSPATANIIAKTASGIADDLLSTVILVGGNKTVFALAMNDNMYSNPITQENIDRLRRLGYGIIEPEEGTLACGVTGRGRLADEKTILAHIDRRLNGHSWLKDRKVIVTAGPTREYIDPIRFISNRSSGKMGYALAEIAARESADVLLISGPSDLKNPVGVRTIRVETANEMHSAVLAEAAEVDFLLMAAAVEDLSPAQTSTEKIKKESGFSELKLKYSPDVIRDFRKLNRQACVVGFSVEIESAEHPGAKARSLAKLKDKEMDFVAWNDPGVNGAAFGHETNSVTLLSKDGQEWVFPLASKYDIADSIIATVIQNYKKA